MRVLTRMVLTFVGGEIAGMLCVGGDGAHAKVHQLLSDSVPLALQLQQYTKTSVKQRDTKQQGRCVLSRPRQTEQTSHVIDETNRAEVLDKIYIIYKHIYILYMCVYIHVYVFTYMHVHA